MSYREGHSKRSTIALLVAILALFISAVNLFLLTGD